MKPIHTLPVVLLALGLFGAGCSADQAQTDASQKTIPAAAVVPLEAKIASVKGKVTFQPKDGKAVDAATSTEVHAGDTLTTGYDGSASIEFFSGSRTALDANSKLVINQDSMDPNQWDKQRISLTLETGRAWSRILKLLDASSTYEMTYNGITSSVRGTAFLLSGHGNQFELDEFDGTVHIAGTSTTGDVPTGFSAAFQTDRPPTDIHTILSPTPDEAYVDYWVQDQLKADQDFAKRAVDIRNQNGANDTAGNIGNETGPFTLNMPGMVHSGFYHVKITTDGDRLNIPEDGSLQLHAFPEFNSPDGSTSTHSEVTDLVTWQLSDPTLGNIDINGTFHAAHGANGVETVIARWNDSTHEHSGSIRLTVGTVAVLNSNATFSITPAK